MRLNTFSIYTFLFCEKIWIQLKNKSQAGEKFRNKYKNTAKVKSLSHKKVYIILCALKKTIFNR